MFSIFPISFLYFLVFDISLLAGFNNCKGLYVLPSSIHELILVPDNGDMNKNYMMQMVREVNSTEVRPDEI